MVYSRSTSSHFPPPPQPHSGHARRPPGPVTRWGLSAAVTAAWTPARASRASRAPAPTPGRAREKRNALRQAGSSPETHSRRKPSRPRPPGQGASPHGGSGSAGEGGVMAARSWGQTPPQAPGPFPAARGLVAARCRGSASTAGLPQGRSSPWVRVSSPEGLTWGGLWSGTARLEGGLRGPRWPMPVPG